MLNNKKAWVLIIVLFISVLLTLTLLLDSLFIGFLIEKDTCNGVCSEGAIRTTAVCRSLQLDSCYVFCKDYKFKCMVSPLTGYNDWLPIGDDYHSGSCYEKGWTDPRTGVKYE